MRACPAKVPEELNPPPEVTLETVLSASGDTYDRGRQFALPFSWVGVPSVSVPCGFDAKGLPIGMQLVGDEMREALLLQIAAAFEGATPYHRIRPPIFTTVRI